MTEILIHAAFGGWVLLNAIIDFGRISKRPGFTDQQAILAAAVRIGIWTCFYVAAFVMGGQNV